MGRDLPIVALASGDAAGIGPEICLKAALDPAVRAVARPIIFADPEVLAQHVRVCGLRADLAVVARVTDADWAPERVAVLTCPIPELDPLAFGAVSAASGRAALACCSAAVRAALKGEVDAVVAAPHNQTAIVRAGIPFDGYPSFVARETGCSSDDVFLMLCFRTFKIAHVTLHTSVRDALAMLTRERVLRAIRAADAALKRLGTAAPKICVGGLNPHAGEGGLFGREEADTIAPAVADAVAQGILAEGPFGADTMLHRTGVDAFVVMLHDQGHIAAKLLAPEGAAALTIGVPILFSSVAHGSAHDIAGKGLANPQAMIEAIARLAYPQSTRP